MPVRRCSSLDMDPSVIDDLDHFLRQWSLLQVGQITNQLLLAADSDDYTITASYAVLTLADLGRPSGQNDARTIGEQSPTW